MSSTVIEVVHNEISRNIFIQFDNLYRYIIHLTAFGYKLLMIFVTTSAFSAENVELNFLLFILLMLECLAKPPGMLGLTSLTVLEYSH